MKFQKKLAITFMRLFLIILTVIGVFISAWSIHSTLKDTVSYNLNLYAILYADMESRMDQAESETTESKMTCICDDFVESLFSPDIEVFVTTKEGKEVYSSENNRTIPDDPKCYPSEREYIYNTIIGKYLYISSIVSYDECEYYLIYSADISNVYRRIGKYIMFWLFFLILSAMVSAWMIVSFSQKVSRPIQELTVRLQNRESGRSMEPISNQQEIIEMNQLFSAYQEMNQKIEDQIAELESKNDEKQRFIDSLTHEIRTPLTSIIGYSSLMENMQFEEKKARESFHTIHENGVRIQNLTENLVRMISVKTDEKQFEQFSLEQLLMQIRNSFALRMKEDAVDIDIDGEDIILFTDKELFRIMVSNFVDNAMKAVREQPEKKIILRIEKSSLSVIDTGKGIPKEDIEKVFEPFFMVDRSRKKDMGGFGLGLSISDNIRKKLGMKIAVKSRIGEGTMITIEFPPESIA